MTPGNVYKPTSLDFINRPNPVEPQSVPQQHPLHGVPQLSQVSNKEILRVLYGSSVHNVGSERPAKRGKSGDAQSLDLPELPVRQNAKRLRIPPTLSGLHHPPPNAGLLPSISVEQPTKQTHNLLKPVNERTSSAQAPALQVSSADRSDPVVASVPRDKRQKSKRRKWSEDETAFLLKGVAHFGVGNWTKILNYPDYSFGARTALDLKDRFRVCCPDTYKQKRTRDVKAKDQTTDRSTSPIPRPSRQERKSEAELAELGINRPFDKSKRRKRHGYSEAEDKALLKGFTAHGKQWAVIRTDQQLGLGHRTATDLRDRMRNRYPAEYAEAGLALGRREATQVGKGAAVAGTNAASYVTWTSTESAADGSTKQATDIDTINEQPRQMQMYNMLHPPNDDVFFGAAFDEDFDTGPITLDRGILDWAQDGPHTRATIDPIATRNLPRPTAMSGWSQVQSQAAGAASVLPSLAAITANRGTHDEVQWLDGDLELPSLVSGGAFLDGEAGRGGHIYGVEELLS
ncbi:hypothetical protein LTR62_006912 [Meristemomyces frigidus]|uniref:Uncharacterized protein n=1 Tax=Meristemomyces frigidus TaxID=1508187 RepID=A0AAN7TC45_9PEZI|nr:hypothetical protein LTR62_006912 [Meristemomyces frigidus]